ncbi:MAG TPA: YceD family protein [Solirubrobacteraceae bacterium]|nr:YceD family protein [Solirubrobacteraceae bacterium]
MPPRSDTFDLGALRLTSGEGRRLELSVSIDPYTLGGERYPVAPELVPVRLDISRTTGDGYALRLRFSATLAGPCMRCLEAAAPEFTVDAREVSQRGETDELASPYVEDGILDLRGWARDALALALPATLLCKPDCLGLCPVCGADLNAAGPDHRHEREPDPRWAKLSELRFDN